MGYGGLGHRLVKKESQLLTGNIPQRRKISRQERNQLVIVAILLPNHLIRQISQGDAHGVMEILIR